MLTTSFLEMSPDSVAVTCRTALNCHGLRFRVKTCRWPDGGGVYPQTAAGHSGRSGESCVTSFESAHAHLSPSSRMLSGCSTSERVSLDCVRLLRLSEWCSEQSSSTLGTLFRSHVRVSLSSRLTLEWSAVTSSPIRLDKNGHQSFCGTRLSHCLMTSKDTGDGGTSQCRLDECQT